jgi:molecular chaperone GrpE (heat shock protein)
MTLAIRVVPRNHNRIMNDRRPPTLTKWPFYAADVVLFLMALWIFNHYPHPLPLWPAVLMVGCVAGAALLGILPFHLEYQAAVKFAEANELTTVAAQMDNFHTVADQIRAATGQWQTVQEHSTKSVTAAKEISERMAAEAKAFSEFMRKANDTEKAALRLEIEKLKRGEGQWLQVIVHLLDHVFALYQAGARSGQPNLEAQLGSFQEACRDMVRRVGLIPIEAATSETFDPEKHQVVDGEPQPAADSRIAQTLATGYSFQGQLLRKTVVALQKVEAESDSPAEIPTAVIGEAVPVESDTMPEEFAPEASPVADNRARSESEMAAEQEFHLESDDLEDGNEGIRQARA